MTKSGIRDAKQSDVPEIMSCIRAAYADAAARLPDLPDVAGGVEDDIQSNIVRVMDVGSRIVAVMVLLAGKEHVKLANIAVHPDCAGQGIGRLLLEDADRITRSLKLNDMQLVTHADMAGNIAMYRHLGWDEYDTIGSSVLMRKTV